MESPITTLIQAFDLSALGVILVLLLGLALSAYVKIVTVLGILRAGIGLYGIPSAFVTGVLSVALAYFVMYPTIERSAEASEQIIQSGGSQQEALSMAMGPWVDFMEQHSKPDVRSKFQSLATKEGQEVGDPSQSQRIRIAAPSFLVSELQDAFAIGLSLFLPFLVIELVVAHIVAAIGLERFEPHLLALPFKILLFVLVDGWTLIATNLIVAYQ